MVDGSRTCSELGQVGWRMMLEAVETVRSLCLLQAPLSMVARDLLLVSSADPTHLGHHSWQVRPHWFETRQALWRRRMWRKRQMKMSWSAGQTFEVGTSWIPRPRSSYSILLVHHYRCPIEVKIEGWEAMLQQSSVWGLTLLTQGSLAGLTA